MKALFFSYGTRTVIFAPLWDIKRIDGDCYVTVLLFYTVIMMNFPEVSAPHFTTRTPTDVVHMRVVGIYRSARGREGSPNGGDRALSFWLPGATDPRQRRGWEQTAAATGVREARTAAVFAPKRWCFRFQTQMKRMPADARIVCVHVCLVTKCSARVRDFSAISQKRDTEEAIFVYFLVASVSSSISRLPLPFNRQASCLLLFIYFTVVTEVRALAVGS